MKKKPSTEKELEKKEKKRRKRSEPIPFSTSLIGFLKPEQAYSRVLIILALLVCFSLSAGVRFNQYLVWKQTPEKHFVKDTPMMTTLDAYFWTKPAREYKDGITKGIPDRAIVFLMAKLSSFFGNNVYKAGFFMIPIIGSLFVIPLCLYFFRLNLPASGVLGSLVGTFSFIYMARSCIGRVRNDSMHLVFLFLASLFILNTKDKDRRTILIYSALSGLTMALFYWWYANPVFNGAYLFTLVLFLLINKVERKTILLSAGVFVLFSNPLAFWQLIPNAFDYFLYFKRYFVLSTAFQPSGNIAFPEVLQTITETQHTPLNEMLAMILSQSFLSGFGLSAFFVVCALYWRLFIPLIPVLLLAFTAFKSSNRFAMYLAPFIGVGLGYSLDILLNSFTNATGIAKKRPLIRDLTLYAVSFLFFFLISSKTAVSFIPTPSVPTEVYSAFQDISTKIPRKSLIFTWWDYGHAIYDVVGADVIHDGARHGGFQTYYVARGLVTDSQSNLYNIIKCLDSVGNQCTDGVQKTIDDNKTPEEMLNFVFGYTGKVTHKDSYVLFTYDMVSKFSSMYFIGAWDFGSKAGQFSGYQQLGCESMQNGILKCGSDNFDINKGLINGRPGIKRIVFTKNGRVMQEKTYLTKEGFNLEILINNSNTVFAVYALNDVLFNSNFNQMYLLGKYDNSLYEEVYNKFPLARLYKVKQNR